MSLSDKGRQALKLYCSQMAESYGVENASERFNISGPMETKLHQALLESADFLKSITYTQVLQITGQAINVGGRGLITGRSSTGRFSSGQDVSGTQYVLTKTDSCAYVPWTLLAVWGNSGKPKEFMQKMMANTKQRFALDIISVGWNGTKVSADTDPIANPLGEDVNIGWHALVKRDAPEQVMVDAIYFNPSLPKDAVPKAGEYRTLDAIVVEMKAMLHPSIRNDPRLRVYVGSDLTAAAGSHLMNQASTPSEKIASLKLENDIGGVLAETPPNFPGKRIVLTIPTNLHCYDQMGTQERESANVSDRERHEDKWWRMEGYAVGEYEAYAAVDEAAITIGAAPAV